MRIVSVVGARSELVKAAPAARALAGRHDHQVIHTGEAFDYGTSAGFFEDLGIDPPEHNLGLGAGTHAEVVGRMLQRLPPILGALDPDWILIYGNSNATLAGALVGATARRRVAHVEAGVRSYRRGTPDELNPIVVDHVAELHLCPTEHAVHALAREGIVEGVVHVGDVLLDNMARNFERARTLISDEELKESIELESAQPFAFATFHHLENTEDETRLTALIESLSGLAWPVLLPLHPRTQASLGEHPDLVSRIGANVHIVDPLRPLVTMRVLARAKVVLTDSGGLQRESYYAGVPCITLRDDTEWVETLDLSANVVVGADVETIREAVDAATRAPRREPAVGQMTAFGDGHAGERIVEVLEERP